MRLLLCLSLAVLSCAARSSAQVQAQANAPQTVPNPPRETPAAVAQYVTYDSHKNTLLLEHIRVIDGTGAPAIEDASLLIRNGRVERVGTSRDKIAAGNVPPIVRLDLSGYTVFPGLVGMHDHMYYIARPDLDAQGHSEPPLVVPQMTFTSPHLYLGPTRT